eukprot:NODE_1866_length_1046_cov_309.475277.p1 GENE.NODE_1866_length_1046_cov_309.475277~~NODE_1866_length_1046_cov_309.475277.p1  ORF type:complete len:276 (-),score=75.72 NODE_1866_length_1046_cov_309.475277:201-908(-)
MMLLAHLTRAGAKCKKWRQSVVMATIGNDRQPLNASSTGDVSNASSTANVSAVDKAVERAKEVITVTASMMLSWSVYYANQALLTTSLRGWNDGFQAMMLAFFSTVVACCLIAMLHRLTKNEGWLHRCHASLKEDLRELANLLIKAYGVLIGFAWEQTFDVAITQISKFYSTESVQPYLIKLIFALAVAVPATAVWARVFLKKAITIEETELSEEEAIRASSGSASNSYNPPTPA